MATLPEDIWYYIGEFTEDPHVYNKVTRLTKRLNQRYKAKAQCKKQQLGIRGWCFDCREMVTMNKPMKIICDHCGQKDHWILIGFCDKCGVIIKRSIYN